MVLGFRNLVLLGVCWSFGLILPHFQSDPGLADLAFDTFVVALLAYSVWVILNQDEINSCALNFWVTGLFISLFLASYLSLQFGFPVFYDIWSHLGSGPMEIEGRPFPFGDLAATTKAATCPGGVVLAVNSCDPWQRAFNQNPDVPGVLNFTGLTNLAVLGIGSFLLLVVLLLAILRKKKIESIAFALFIFSPAVALAVDRGNEVLTLLFILVGLVTLQSKTKLMGLVSGVFFFSAIFLKLWPILLVFLLTIFSTSRTRIRLLLVLIPSVGYWLLNLTEINKMISSTQEGSPHGVAFGLKLFFSERTSFANSAYLMVFSLVIVGGWVFINSKNAFKSTEKLMGDHRLTILVPLMLTYVGIWAVSDSFIYRMLVLLPTLLILIEPDLLEELWVRSLVAMILVTVISSRLAVTTAISTSLALVMLFISVAYTKQRVESYLGYSHDKDLGIATNK